MPGYTAKQQRSVVVICFHILLLCHRSAIQPRRKERSSAQLPMDNPWGGGIFCARPFDQPKDMVYPSSKVLAGVWPHFPQKAPATGTLQLEHIGDPAGAAPGPAALVTKLIHH